MRPACRRIVRPASWSAVCVGAMALAATSGATILNASNVLTPGQSGVATSANFSNQFTPYRTWEQKPMPVIPPTGLTVTTPRAGVTLQRDSFGVPFVKGTTQDDMAFGAGWAVADDRFYQADILRHQAEGRLAEYRGSVAVTSDVVNRREAATDEELLAQWATHSAEEQALLDQFTQGMNAWLTDATARSVLPAEYTTLGLKPDPWRVVDSLHIAHYLARSMAGGGRELRNARLLTLLRARVRDKETAIDYFNDAIRRNDPAATATVAGQFTTRLGGRGGIHAKGVAVPARPPTSVSATRDQGPFQFASQLSSGAVAVAPGASATGSALHVAFLDTGYMIPQTLVELALEAPGITARGATIPGLGPFLLSARTDTAAYALTAAKADQVDIWAEKLRAKSKAVYRYKRRWTRLTERKETILRRPAFAGDAPVVARRLTIRRSVHGTVIAEGKIGARRVLFTKSRMSEGKELTMYTTLAALLKTTGWAGVEPTLADFAPSAGIVWTDPGRIAYRLLGTYPVRRSTTDERLPVWGTGPFDHIGILPAARLPRTENPTSGFIVAWANRPQLGWPRGDSSPFGPLHRAGLLKDLLRQQRPLTMTEVGASLRQASDSDSRFREMKAWTLYAARLLDNATSRDAASEIRRWDGRRLDVDDDGKYDAPGVAIFDAYVRDLELRLVAPIYGIEGLDQLGVPFDTTFSGTDRAALLVRALRLGRPDVRSDGPWPKSVRRRRLSARSFARVGRVLQTTFGTADTARWVGERNDMLMTPLTPGTAFTILPDANRGVYEQYVEIGP